MKKKIIILISIILIILTIVTVILIIKNKEKNKVNNTIQIKGNIDEKTFEELIKFESINEESAQIVSSSFEPDRSDVNYYNFKFDKKTVFSLSKSTCYLPSNQGVWLNKYEYELTDEDVVAIKGKLEKLNEISNEDDTVGFLDKRYCVRTKDGEKNFSDNEQANQIIDEIMDIVYKIPDYVIINKDVESK